MSWQWVGSRSSAQGVRYAAWRDRGFANAEIQQLNISLLQGALELAHERALLNAKTALDSDRSLVECTWHAGFLGA